MDEKFSLKIQKRTKLAFDLSDLKNFNHRNPGVQTNVAQNLENPGPVQHSGQKSWSSPAQNCASTENFQNF